MGTAARQACPARLQGIVEYLAGTHAVFHRGLVGEREAVAFRQGGHIPGQHLRGIHPVPRYRGVAQAGTAGLIHQPEVQGVREHQIMGICRVGARRRRQCHGVIQQRAGTDGGRRGHILGQGQLRLGNGQRRRGGTAQGLAVERVTGGVDEAVPGIAVRRIHHPRNQGDLRLLTGGNLRQGQIHILGGAAIVGEAIERIVHRSRDKLQITVQGVADLHITERGGQCGARYGNGVFHFFTDHRLAGGGHQGFHRHIQGGRVTHGEFGYRRGGISLTAGGR